MPINHSYIYTSCSCYIQSPPDISMMQSSVGQLKLTYTYIFIRRSGRNKTTCMQTYNKKNRKETQQYLSNKKLNYQTADNNVNRMLTSVNKLLLLHKTIRARLHALLLTTSNFTQQIITSMKFIFEFLYSFGPTHTLGRSKPKSSWQNLTTSILLII